MSYLGKNPYALPPASYVHRAFLRRAHSTSHDSHLQVLQGLLVCQVLQGLLVCQVQLSPVQFQCILITEKIDI